MTILGIFSAYSGAILASGDTFIAAAAMITALGGIVGGWFVFVRDSRKDRGDQFTKAVEVGVASLEASLRRSDAEVLRLTQKVDLLTERVEQLTLTLRDRDTEIALLRGP